MSEKRYKLRTVSSHDFERDPILEGRIVDMDPIDVEGSERRSIVVDSGDAMARVFESKALEEIWDLGELGDMVKLTFGGKKPLPGGHSFSRFSVVLWSDDDSAAVKRMVGKTVKVSKPAPVKKVKRATGRKKR